MNQLNEGKISEEKEAGFAFVLCSQYNIVSDKAVSGFTLEKIQRFFFIFNLFLLEPPVSCKDLLFTMFSLIRILFLSGFNVQKFQLLYL